MLIGPDCEIGPNATLYGPTVVESGSYLGPGAEIRRCLLLAGAEVAHTSYVGIRFSGARYGWARSSAGRSGTCAGVLVHMFCDGRAASTPAEVTIGCVIADGT